jgi:dTDP-4-amino-4,6-dideoxygalactose transaminase
LHKTYNIDHPHLGSQGSPYTFWKGRVALYAILRALGTKAGDEVVLPAMTCVVVPNAITYLGAKAVYVDVEPRTFNIDVDRIEEKITSKTRAILAQNTFGLSSDIDQIGTIAERHGLKVIEDCAHGCGGTYKGQPNGTAADAAFYSSQWNKPFSTGIGGFAVAKDKAIAARLKELENEACIPSFKEKVLLRAQLLANDHLLTQKTYWTALAVYRLLSRHNVVVGSSRSEELESPAMPENFLKGMSNVQISRAEQELERFTENLNHRRRIAAMYKEILKSLSIELPYEPSYATHTFLKFALLVKDRDRFLKEAEGAKVEVGDWFVSPLHPIRKDFHLWNYRYGENPIAERLSRHLVNLHTHLRITDRHVEKVAIFLKKHRSNILDSVDDCLHADAP